MSSEPMTAIVHVGDAVDDLPAPVDGPVERVIVVGAGIAGLVAARALHLSGIDVVVVEGRDRIGGRTHTIELGGGAAVDLGASWIHDGEGSPTLPLVEALGIERMLATSTGIAVGASILDRGDGSFPSVDRRQALTAAMAELFMSAANLDRLEPGADLETAMASLLDTTDPNVRGTLGALLSMNEGKDADEVDFATFASVFFAPGAEHVDVMPRGGYRGVVDHLASGLDIRTSEPVRRITQDEEGVTVETMSATLTGTHVIVTVPLGVLKAETIALEPPLPPAHIEAIRRVGFGVLEKVALAYERPAWRVDGAPAHVTIVDSPRPEWPVILDLSTWYDVPVVVGMATGDHGRKLASMTEHERVAALHATVCEIGGPDTPDPIAFATTSWATDPFVLGCYANIAPGTDVACHAADLSALATPHGRVLFAGEHTCERGTSTVDSAWITGVREASRLLQRREVPLQVIALVRHGETEWTITGQHTSRTDVPLTDEGRRQAAALTSTLARRHFALVLSSPMQRALETCRLAGFGDHCEISDDLVEWDYGSYEGRTTEEIRAKEPGWTLWDGSPELGESIDAITARADRVITRIEAIDGDTLVFSHGHFLRVLTARWLGLDAEDGRLLALSPASVSTLDREREQRVIASWNLT